MKKYRLGRLANALLLGLAFAGMAEAQNTRPPTAVAASGAPAPSRDSPPLKAVPSYPSTYPAIASGVGPRAGFYYVSRWAEDWRFLADPPPGYRRDPFDPLKLIRFTADGNVYVTLSDEERFRVNYTTSPGLKQRPDQEQGLLRSVVGADLHLGSDLRIYGELNSSQDVGRNIKPISTIQRNDLIVQQLFAEAHAQVAGGTVGTMVGRQEFQDGPPSLQITLRAASNVYTVFNGVKLYGNWSGARVFAFDFRTTQYGEGRFDDPVLHGEKLKGVGGSVVVPAAGQARLFFDPLYYRYDNDAKQWGPTVGDEQRDIYGARLWGSIGALTVDVTGIRQTGSFDGRRVSAWGGSGLFEYLLSDRGVMPRIGFHSDYASGGGAYGHGALRDFNYLYGSVPYYSNGSFLAPINLRTYAPFVRINPTPNLRLTAEVEVLRRENDHDAIYTNTGPYAGTQNVRGHDFGVLYRGDAAWAMTRHWSAVAYVEYLKKGAVLDKAGYHDSAYVGGALTFRF